MKAFKTVIALLSAILVGGYLAHRYKGTFPSAPKAAKTPSHLSIAIGRIHGAPEYIEHRVREAVFNELEERGVVAEATKRAFLVNATFIVERDEATETTSIKLVWDVRSPEGRRLGDVTQRNKCLPKVEHETCRLALMLGAVQDGAGPAAIGILQLARGQ